MMGTTVDEIDNPKLNNEMDKVEELTPAEYMTIFGGRPTTETTLFYDAGWWVGTAIREVESWFE